MDVINRISSASSADSRHRLHFVRDGAVQSMSLAELEQRAARVAWKLHDLGLRPGHRVGVMAVNSVEWVTLDLAILKVGAVTAGFEAGRFDAPVAVSTYGLEAIFVDRSNENNPRILEMGRVRTWAETADPRESSLPSHPAYEFLQPSAIKFTSGSTGQPKGLEACVGSINDSLNAAQEMFRHGDGDNILTFLRQALLQQRYWTYSALAFGHDISVTTMDHVLPMAQSTRPTVVMAVPSFYEDTMRRVGSLRAVERGASIQALLGGRIRYLWTGSAPCNRTTLDFFHEAGVPLYEGYGLNETCIVAKNHPGACRLGSVGRVLPNKTVRLDEDGILIVGARHPVNTRFTWCKEGDSERMFLPTGEVKTHDLAYLDADNYLYILGRVDDIIVASSGRNVLVRPIEERLKGHPAVHECVLYGNGKPFLTALVSPASPRIDRDGIQRHIEAMNASALPEQKIHALVIADEPFSLDNGLLTSQFKPIRREIYRHLAAKIDEQYR